ncbi:MAG TPA: sugar ABC transporter substrate-binding protein, partial [Lacipirellulaceae bacterium]|nr:sugar ABC transporter substrate-binding protein [Lacipirellulaceae bacterium]
MDTPLVRCVVGLALLAAAAPLGGCGRGAGDAAVVVEFWAMGAEGERVKPLVAEFERSHPGIRIHLQQIPWNAAHEKLLTAFAGDTLPDVCQLGNTWLAEFAALDALADLTERVAGSATIAPEDFFPGVWQSNVLDDRAFGIPWYVDTRVLFYRTDLLAAAGHDRPPGSWDQWRTMLRDLQRQMATSGGRRAERFPILLPINEFEQPIILGLQTGADLLKEGGRYGNFSGPEFRRAFEFYLSLFDDGFAQRTSNTRISNVWQEFERGTFAMYVTGPWNVQEFRARLGPELEDRWATAPWPSPDGDGIGASNAGGCSLVLFQQSPRQDAAWQFVEFMTGRDQQVEMFRHTSNLPARRDAWEPSGLIDDPKYRAFHEQLANVRATPQAPEWEQIVTGELV